jgi:hypothetical protein
MRRWKPYWLGVALTSAGIVAVALASILVPIAVATRGVRAREAAVKVLILEGPDRGRLGEARPSR